MNGDGRDVAALVVVVVAAAATSASIGADVERLSAIGRACTESSVSIAVGWERNGGSDIPKSFAQCAGAYRARSIVRPPPDVCFLEVLGRLVFFLSSLY